LHGEGRPENSLAAITAAVDAGYPVEIDVQVSADGAAVVFHDWNLQRLTGLDAKVVDKTARELAALRLPGGGEKIPLLQDVLAAVNGRQAIVIEIKNRRQPTALEPTIAAILRDYHGPFAIHSFNPFSLGWFARHAPAIMRGQISCAFDTDDMAGWKKVILEHYGMNWMSRPQFIAHHWKRLPAPMPALLRRVFRKPLLAWTVRSQTEADTALRHADNVIFEQFLPPAYPASA
jgi:glycerophosphoryl diester phosphodiesterase